ncbi:ATP-dependent RNA helicase dbp7 [Mycoblastus sanguinarius]|nr:ATP-dependent RNA helicase dbp7 [Mycoblastus sanguinarius]
MADDGMLMNFSLDEDALNTKSVFKGGRWKDRLQAKKSLQRLKERHHTNGALTGSNAVPTKHREPKQDEVDTSRSAKRQKLDGTPNARPRASNSATKPKEVVSSLFTYNPTSKPSATAQTQEDVPSPEPSNAPLTDLSTFTSLGLSSFLSTHLIQSLYLKAPTAIQKATITQLLKEDSDAFIQAETGSGKTLAYLLPIVQRIMALSKCTSNDVDSEKDRKINRTSGLFALILAPTRELTHQISNVLDRLLRPLPWLVAGTVTGGAVKNHEKARLRKGLNILVATPGRLADHLEHTEVLDVGSVRWLVLDEGDRLMELGFEEEIKKIMQMLDDKGVRRRKIGKEKVKGLPEKRTTVMCSATMKMGVQRLGEISLKDAVHIKADPGKPSSPGEESTEQKQDGGTAFLAPSQLKQSYIVAPAKQRLVTLAALLKRTFARKGSVMKAIVFLSCADSVDFHFEAFSRKEIHPPKESSSSDQNSKSNKHDRKTEYNHSSSPIDHAQKTTPTSSKVDLPTVAPATALASFMNPSLKLYKLHGSLTQPIRSATLTSFTRSPEPSILLCTDVASRGLDLPNIDIVIEYDPPFSSDDHLHRVGRTARAGMEGKACCFLMPGAEERYVGILKEGAGESIIKGEVSEEILRKGFENQVASSKDQKEGAIRAGKWDEKATEWQLEVERWVVENKRAGEMARKAFVSHVRAYSTHVVKEREMFDVKALHLGHLAKAFALRERPGTMNRASAGGPEKPARRGHGEKRSLVDRGGDEMRSQKPDLDLPAKDGQDAARKMRAKMKEHMAGASEFNIG